MGFQSLLDKFAGVLDQFHEILRFSLFTRLGLRYINLIEEGITDIDPRLQGFQLKGDLFKKNQFLTKIDTTQYSQEGIIKIQATRIGDKKIISGAQNIFIPPDLTEMARWLTFKRIGEPKQDFLLVDLDHFSAEQGDFDAAKILGRFHELQEGIYQGFCNAIGEKNLANWSVR